MVNVEAFEPDKTEFKFCFCHLLALWFWLSCFSSQFSDLETGNKNTQLMGCFPLHSCLHSGLSVSESVTIVCSSSELTVLLQSGKTITS